MSSEFKALACYGPRSAHASRLHHKEEDKDPPRSCGCEASWLRVSYTMKPKILRNLARIFPTFSGRPLWSAQACLRLSGAEATPHEQRRQQAAALQRAHWTIVLVAAGLLRTANPKILCCLERISRLMENAS